MAICQSVNFSPSDSSQPDSLAKSPEVFGGVEGERRRVESIREQGDTPLPCEIQAICLGETALLGWPGEVFSSLGMAAKRGSPFAQTYVVGYANGSIGYVPTPEAFAEGGYEARCALHLADHAGEVLVEESLDLLQKLRR